MCPTHEMRVDKVNTDTLIVCNRVCTNIINVTPWPQYKWYFERSFIRATPPEKWSKAHDYDDPKRKLLARLDYVVYALRLLLLVVLYVVFYFRL